MPECKSEFVIFEIILNDISALYYLSTHGGDHTRVPGLVTFTTGLKQMIFFEGGPFQLRLIISRINMSVKW